MMFRIPFGAHGAIYNPHRARVLDRRSRAMTPFLAFSASSAFVLIALLSHWAIQCFGCCGSSALFVTFFRDPARDWIILPRRASAFVVVVTLRWWDQ